jgi:hypothetical protein
MIWIHKILQKVRQYIARFAGHSTKPTRLASPEEHPSADELRSIINNAKTHAENAQTVLDRLGSRLQNVIDGADATLPLVSYLNPSEIEDVGVLWNEVARQTEHSYHWLEEAYPSTDAASGTVSLTTTTTIGIFSPKIVPFSSDHYFNDAWIHYIEITNRPTLKEEVTDLIRTFHLDIASPGKKSTLELFETAHRAYEVPVSKGNPVITSLLPLREAVESAIDELLRRRPQQMPSGSSYSKKLLSIGNQLKKDIIADVVVQEWADQWHDISDKDLSASKRYQMTREEWSHKLSRATQFFHSFLTGLDVAKLRK